MTTDQRCIRFLRWALPRLDLRWAGFRKVRRQVCRRISKRVAELGLADLDSYPGYLEAHPDEWPLLDALCRVTISRFFRDRGLWSALGSQVLPELAARAADEARSLRAWSAGCASGEEAYSVKVVWEFEVARDVPPTELEIVATDVDPVMLERARRGCYAEASLRELPASYIERAFQQKGKRLCIGPEYRSGIDFFEADLGGEPPAGPFDLILCRNLALTYYAAERQRRTLARLLEVLRPGGILAIGSHETLPDGLHLEPIDGAPCCFRR